MRRLPIIKALVCFLSLGSVLYAYLEKQNDFTRLRIELPHLAKEVRLIEEEVERLKYDVERFENPKHLMELAKRPEFSHLKYSLLDEVIVMKKAKSLDFTKKQEPSHVKASSSKIFIGAKQ